MTATVVLDTQSAVGRRRRRTRRSIFLITTVTGLPLDAIGGNPSSARYAGVRVGRMTVAAYAANGALIGVVALLTTSRRGSGNPTAPRPGGQRDVAERRPVETPAQYGRDPLRMHSASGTDRSHASARPPNAAVRRRRLGVVPVG
ncbi:hypothetical protein M4I32_13500 [Microbacterium sp. LRZ72]|uniref:ABC transporter permease subunit n=1 Tax=Microbacterium sp. LRZ72 TaxID=2942481 RepID=UPI0029BA111A|nr:hypothetical protein [Microbacterium sp. LRZ72]MDX2377814.1 hypothetical protein [Microbacterium sp. LRZ72]